MKRFVISVVAICATLFFVSCGGDSKTPTPSDDSDSVADTGHEGGDTDTATDSGHEGGDTDTATDTEHEGGDTDTATDSGHEGGDTDTNDPDTDDPDTDETDTAPEGCELSEFEQNFVGTWAQKIILRSSSSTEGVGSALGKIPSVTTRYVVAEIRANKDCKLDFFKKGNQICRTDNRTGDNVLTYGHVGFNSTDESKFNTVFHHWKPADIPGHENDPYLEIAENGEEISFKLNKDFELRGANMDDPSTETMVDSDDDPRIFDHDGDGNAAFTILFTSAFASGKMYYVQRLWHIFTGKVVSEGKIEGNVKWSDEQYAHQSTKNDNLKSKKDTETDETKSVFQLVKVDDSMDCATLLGQADTIFDIVDPNTDVPHNKYEE